MINKLRRLAEKARKDFEKGRTAEMPDDQSWFWTSEWQIGEREADEDLASGRFKTFAAIDELIADLQNDEAEK